MGGSGGTGRTSAECAEIAAAFNQNALVLASLLEASEASCAFLTAFMFER